jgi:hypothetical protein
LNGESGENFMNSTILDSAEPIGNVTIVDDFLPPPEQLVPKKNTVRLTLDFTKESIEFLQREAQSQDASYEVMIRKLVDAYVQQQGQLL